MATLSTHVLDTARGHPAAGIRVTLEALVGNESVEGASGITDEDGRFRFDGDLEPGNYRLTFAVHEHLGDDAFYRRIPIEFFITESDEHYHVPLLLSPFGYTTYRGS
jgi:5-hydroxyisourate hydrolase